MLPKILLVDIETAPNLVHCWGLWQQNISLNQIIKPGYTLCWAAKWLGEDEMFFSSIYKNKPKQMLKKIHELLNEADAVVHYNGDRFDIPTLNKDFLQHGFTPASPSKQMDLLTVVKKQFRFPSNKLDYVSKALGVGSKTKHEGHELWIKCMENDPVAWSKMEEYNKQDVLLLERVYGKIKPWIKNHISFSMLSEDGLVCPNCGSKHYHKRGFAFTSASKFQRYHCANKSCGNWFRGNKNLGHRVGEKFVNVI